MYSYISGSLASLARMQTQHEHRMTASARSRAVVASPPPMLALTALLLACAAAAAAGYSLCDDASCGKGHCVEVPEVIPYHCVCDPGWSNVFKDIHASPCMVPDCTFDTACFNITPPPLRGIPITDICVAVYCGPGGTCKNGPTFWSYTCECQEGYNHVLNISTLPCVKHCSFGADCAAQGLAPPPESPPPPPPQSSPAPPAGNHDGSSGPPPPKGNATAPGSVSVQNLLQLLLLLLSVAMVWVV